MSAKASDSGSVTQSGPWKQLAIERSSTAERVAEGLRTMILTGDLRAGTPLREVEAAKAFDVSRNTVREAFLLLQGDRLLVHQAHRGVSVKQLDDDDVRDLYRVRLLIQLEAVRHAGTLTPERLRPIRDLLDAAAQAGEIHRWQDVVTHDVRFHQALVGLADSPRLDAIFAALMTELRLGLSLMEEQAATPWLAANQHLFTTLARKGLAAFADELRTYLSESEAALLAELATDDGKPPGETESR
jgi:DNA-binding GntR family transcriptional regulator